MIRERLGRGAVGLHPKATRAERGQELVGTLLDAGDASHAAFAAQLTSLAVGGIAARSRLALTQPLGRVALDAVCWAAVLSIVRPLSVVLASQLGRSGFESVSLVTVLVAYVGPVVMLALFTAGRTRLAGSVGLAYAIARLTVHLGSVLGYPGGLRAVLLLLPGFGLLAFSPRRTPMSGRGLWIAPAVAVALIASAPAPGQLSPLLMITPVLVALVFLPLWPGFALGTALAWTYLSAEFLTLAGSATTRVEIALLSAPLTLLAAGVARRIAHRT